MAWPFMDAIGSVHGRNADRIRLLHGPCTAITRAVWGLVEAAAAAAAERDRLITSRRFASDVVVVGDTPSAQRMFTMLPSEIGRVKGLRNVDPHAVSGGCRRNVEPRAQSVESPCFRCGW